MSSALTVGQWGMFTGPEGKQLVILDQDPVGPVSARKVLEETPRRLLLNEGRVAAATAGDTADVSEVVESGGERLRVETRRIVSPWSRTVVGVLAGVWPADEVIPEPPLVGSWEWVVQQSGKTVTGRRTFWNRELFDLYEVDSETARAAGYWEVDVWASELVSRNDSLRFFTSLRDGYWDDWTGVRCATFDAIAGYGTAERRKKHLRLVAQKGAMSTDTELIFQGFSYEVPEAFADRALADEYPTDSALGGLLSLVQEPMAIVDPFSLEVLMTTPGWRREGFGNARSLKEILAEDPAPVRQFMIDAADAGPGESTSELLMGADVGPQRYEASVIGLDRGPTRDALAALRVERVVSGTNATRPRAMRRRTRTSA